MAQVPFGCSRDITEASGGKQASGGFAMQRNAAKKAVVTEQGTLVPRSEAVLGHWLGQQRTSESQWPMKLLGEGA